MKKGRKGTGGGESIMSTVITSRKGDWGTEEGGRYIFYSIPSVLSAFVLCACISYFKKKLKQEK